MPPRCTTPVLADVWLAHAALGLAAPGPAPLALERFTAPPAPRCTVPLPQHLVASARSLVSRKGYKGERRRLDFFIGPHRLALIMTLIITYILRFLCYESCVPNTSIYHFLQFSFPLFYHYTSILFLYFFPIPLFLIPPFQTGPEPRSLPLSPACLPAYLPGTY